MEIQDIGHRRISLTESQESCLNSNGERSLMIKGIAGAGKSIVLLAYVQKLRAKYSQDEKNKIGIFTFCNTLNSFTKEVLNIKEEEAGPVVVKTLQSYIESVYHVIGGIQKKKCQKADQMEIMKEALEIHKEKYGSHSFHNWNLRFWIDEIIWMKDMDITVKDVDRYLALPRLGREGKGHMNTADRITAFQVYLEYEKIMKSKGMEDWVDHSLYLLRHQEEIPDSMRFEHVMLDEAQDLSLLQMKTAMLFSRKNMIIAMDMNQRIFDKYWTPDMLGLDVEIKKLTKSMRTTKQIAALAEAVKRNSSTSMLEKNEMGDVLPEMEGSIPQLVHLDNPLDEKRYIIKLIQSWQENAPNASIGIIVAKNEYLERISTWLADYGIRREIITRDTTFSTFSPAVKLVSVHSAKGLEFDRVIIPMFVEGHFPYCIYTDDENEKKSILERSRNILYVAMTRAKYTLVMTYSGNKGSRFIGDMPVGTYQAKGTGMPYFYEEEYVEKKTIKLPPVMHRDEEAEVNESLKDFFMSKGLEVIDQRALQGALWVIGDKKAIGPIIKTAGRLYGAYGFYTAGVKETGRRPGWWTKSNR